MLLMLEAICSKRTSTDWVSCCLGRPESESFVCVYVYIIYCVYIYIDTHTYHYISAIVQHLAVAIHCNIRLACIHMWHVQIYTCTCKIAVVFQPQHVPTIYIYNYNVLYYTYHSSHPQSLHQRQLHKISLDEGSATGASRNLLHWISFCHSSKVQVE